MPPTELTPAQKAIARRLYEEGRCVVGSTLDQIENDMLTYLRLFGEMRVAVVERPMTHYEAERTLAAEGYVLGDLSAVDQARYTAHRWECAQCRANVSGALAVIRGIQGRDGT